MATTRDDELLLPRRCGLYLPGHEVHWVQAQSAGRRLSTEPPIAGHLTGVEQDGTIALDIAGEVERAWTHEPSRLAALASRARFHVSLQRGWGLLRVKRPEGDYLFYVGDADDHLDCPEKAPTGDPLDLLAQTGGFSISLDEAHEHFDGGEASSPSPPSAG